MGEAMKTGIILLVSAVALLGGSWAQAQFIYINLSYKIVLNPADGSRPPGATDEIINGAVERMNAVLASYQRGFRVRLIDPITVVGGAGDTTGPSKWYSVDFRGDDPVGIQKDQMESDARGDVRYHWNDNAINLYINRGTSGGVCSFYLLFGLVERDFIVIVGAGSAWNGDLQLHEIGHFFNLCHTQGCTCDTCGEAGDCLLPGDDLVDDTLSDLACWDQNEIARRNFNNRDYSQLNPGEQARVDDTFYNLMSYHGPVQGAVTDRLTELQLDRLTDTITDHRRFATTGRVWFVDRQNGCALQNGTAACRAGLGGPYDHLIDGLDQANPAGGDIVLIRPGSYNERLTAFAKPVTLRATRQGPVTIGQ
jgi:hypothetical protein